MQVKASVKVKPRLGMGVSGKVKLGPVKIGGEADVITASASGNVENGKCILWALNSLQG